MWNLSKRECVRTLQAHEGFVRGMVVRFCGTSFFTVNAAFLSEKKNIFFKSYLQDKDMHFWIFLILQIGDDKTIKQWKMETPGYGEEEEPLHTILGKVWSLWCLFVCVASHVIDFLILPFCL